jgi:hypothetical protein
MAGQDQEIEGYILDGMARAIWVHAYMIWATQVEPPPVMSGSWEEMAPNTRGSRQASMKAAQALAELVATAMPGHDRTLVDLFEQGVAASGGRRRRGQGTPADMAYAFGEELALICIGTLDPDDGVLPLPPGFHPPSFQIELDDDGHALSWDGGFSFDRNPAGAACEASRPRAYRDFPTPPPARAIHEISNPGTPPTALILEDDLQLQKAMGRWIAKILGKNVRLVTADNVDAAIANLSVHDVDLIVSDVDVLGDKSGVDLFEWVRQHQPDLVDRYIFFTGGHPEVAQIHYRYVPKGGATFEDFKAVYQAPPPADGFGPPRRNPENTNSAAHKAYNALRAAKSKDRAAWLAAAAQLRAAAESPYESDDSRQALIDRAESAEMNAQRLPAAPQMDLKTFANHVGAELPYIVAEPGEDGRAKGRFGDRKVFVAALWRQLRTAPAFHGMSESQFKAHLLAAHRAQLLTLARADLVAAMDTQEVAQSLIQADGAQFHVVVDE